MNAPLTTAQQESAYLARLGDRVRAWRNEHGTTRKALAQTSGLSERYIAQLEAGEGNISVLLLRRLARAMHDLGRDAGTRGGTLASRLIELR